eukprot:1191549-Prorocentrum_minimum.AAC.2
MVRTGPYAEMLRELREGFQVETRYTKQRVDLCDGGIYGIAGGTQGDKRGRVSRVLSAPLPLLAQEDP